MIGVNRPVKRRSAVHVVEGVRGSAVGQEQSDDLDVTASRTGDTVYLHVVNTNRTQSVPAKFAIKDMKIDSAAVFQIAADPEFEVWSEPRDVIAPRRVKMDSEKRYTFPPASVSAVELKVQQA